MNERHLRCIALGVKHAFAEERTAKTDAIEPADQLIAAPGFDAVAMTDLMQRRVEIADTAIDPCVVAAWLRCGASGDGLLESSIDCDAEGVRPNGSRQADATRKPSSGMMPRFSGSTQKIVGSSALSDIGKMPQA